MTPKCCGSNCPSWVISSSVSPALMYSLVLSPVRFSKGSTTKRTFLSPLFTGWINWYATHHNRSRGNGSPAHENLLRIPLGSNGRRRLRDHRGNVIGLRLRSWRVGLAIVARFQDFWLRNEGSIRVGVVLGLTLAKPFVQLAGIRVDCGFFQMLMAMDGKPFGIFPALDGAHFPAEIGGDFFPGNQLFVRER
jgi:hypothetical protein